MSPRSVLDGSSQAMTAVITDSGLGGLLICAGLESRLRWTEGNVPVRLVYVNAWPEERSGYNDLPDLPARAAVFDRALTAMTAFGPDLIVIACNTLSVIYEATAYRRAPGVPVIGILEEGTALFHEALVRNPDAALALFGTRTTIGSGEHIRRLAQLGVEARRIVAEPCHGLAAAIDKDPGAAEIEGLVEECVSRVSQRLPAGGPIYAGLACTHYAYVAQAFRAALARRTGSPVEVLEPGERLVEVLMRGLGQRRHGTGTRPVAVEVVSKVELAVSQRNAVSRRLQAVSPATARALLDYRHSPDLF